METLAPPAPQRLATPPRRDEPALDLWRTFVLAPAPLFVLRTCNGCFVGCRADGPSVLVAERTEAGFREMFELLPQSSDTAVLRAVNGKLVRVDEQGGALRADSNAIGPWETLEIDQKGLHEFALRAANGKYLSARRGGGSALRAASDAARAWETFTILPASVNPPW